MKILSKKNFENWGDIPLWYKKNEDKIASIINIQFNTNYGGYGVYYFEYKVEIIKNKK